MRHVLSDDSCLILTVFPPYTEPTEASRTKADWISSLPLPGCECEREKEKGGWRRERGRGRREDARDREEGVTEKEMRVVRNAAPAPSQNSLSKLAPRM